MLGKKVRIECMWLSLWQTNLYDDMRTCIQCLHADTDSHTHACTCPGASIKMKMISLIFLSTPFLPPLYAYILETPENHQVNFNVKDTKVTQALQSVHSVKRLCVKVCACTVCVYVLYVQCDWWGVGLFICLV